MKKLFHIVLIALGVLTVSCNKFLDTKPADTVTPENYYKNANDLNRALAAVYDRLGDLRVYGGGALVGYFCFSDEFYIKGQTSGYLSNTIDAGTLEVNRCWEALYVGIERANMLLGHLDGADVTDDFRNEVKGQALFLRGYYYFLLVDLFGGVPLKLSYTATSTEPALPRTPVAQVYEQIIKDMKEAEGLVKPITAYNYNGRVSKTAVQGILAKVYLTMAGYPLRDEAKYVNARAYADSVMKSGLHELNSSYQQIFINQSQDIYDIKEDLWEVEFYGNSKETIKEGGYLGSWIGITCPNIDTGFGYDYIHTTGKLFKSYANNDVRRDWSIATFRFVANTSPSTPATPVTRTAWTATQIYERSAGKWRREYELVRPRDQNYTPANFPLLRYADVLLMYAEADNQVSGAPTAAAYEAINKVRRRAFGKPVNTPDASIDLKSLGQGAFLDSVKVERFRELAFEGVRKHDLIRWGTYVSTMQALVIDYRATMPAALVEPAVGEATRVTARSILFPIPNSEIAVNPYLKQNEGW
jgi:hypothetical protein